MSFDTIADALEDRRRRRILFELLDHTSVEQSAVRSETGHEDIAVQLTHNHLPKLDDMEYIAWERNGGTIERGSKFDEIQPTLRLLQQHRDQVPADTF